MKHRTELLGLGALGGGDVADGVGVLGSRAARLQERRVDRERHGLNMDESIEEPCDPDVQMPFFLWSCSPI